MADAAIQGSRQPFHAVAALNLAAAEKFLERCADSTDCLALKGIQPLLDHLSDSGYEAIGSCILVGSGRPLGTLESNLASHPMIHTAEGHFFREAIRRVSQTCRLTVTDIKEREIIGHGAAELRLSADNLHLRLLELGRTVGPPWRQDEKLATLAAWLLFARA